MQYDIDVDANGNWELLVPDNFEVGRHPIVGADNFGNTDSAVFLLKGKEEFRATEVEEIEVEQFEAVQVPGELVSDLFYGGLIFAVIVIISMAGNVFLANRIRSKEQSESLEAIRKWAKKIIVVSALIAALLFTLALLASIQYSSLQSSKNFDVQITEDRLIEVSGILRDPLSREPVEGVTMSAGNVDVTTGNGGVFNFIEIVPSYGIRLEHQKLQGEVYYVPPFEGYQDILFNVDLFNQVLKIRDSESSSGLSIDPLVVLNVERLMEFNSRVGDKVYKNVIRVTINESGEPRTYNFVFNNNEWVQVL